MEHRLKLGPEPATVLLVVRHYHKLGLGFEIVRLAANLVVMMG
jgi:hypothetical protein